MISAPYRGHLPQSFRLFLGRSFLPLRGTYRVFQLFHRRQRLHLASFLTRSLFTHLWSLDLTDLRSPPNSSPLPHRVRSLTLTSCLGKCQVPPASMRAIFLVRDGRFHRFGELARRVFFKFVELGNKHVGLSSTAQFELQM